MKILPFSPPRAPETAQARSPSPAEAIRGDFEKALEDARVTGPPDAAVSRPSVPPPPSGPPPAWSAIGSENLRARQSASEGDLNLAAGLLNGLVESIRAATPGELAKVHRLDGVLYYFQA
ncbi:MAG: hypothetical protein LBR80_01205 [Deltaproteobacteria bacterium]|jgi:hypothetical protein|nr:hypothetical protein [Deltaproteobacteria bacterium]